MDYFRTAEIIKDGDRIDASDYLTELLNDDFTTSIPYGFYYIEDSVISNTTKQINWNGSVVYSDKDIDMLLVRNTRYTHANLEINKQLVESPRADKYHLRLQSKDKHMMYFNFFNLRLIGNENATRGPEEGMGNTFITFDNITDVGNSPLNWPSEIHWGVFEITEYRAGRVVFDVDKEAFDLNCSRMEVYMQGMRMKQVTNIKGSGGWNFHIKHNDGNELLESERDFDLIYIDGKGNSIRKEILDYKEGAMKERQGRPMYYHKFKITNQGDRNKLIDGIYDQDGGDGVFNTGKQFIDSQY